MQSSRSADTDLSSILLANPDPNVNFVRNVQI